MRPPRRTDPAPAALLVTAAGSLLAAAGLVWAAAGAATAAAGPDRAAVPATTPAPARAAPDVGYVNVAATAGLVEVNACGSREKATINETVGNGVCLGDVDDDGLLDIYLPNGLTGKENPRQPPPRSALYRARGSLTYEDVSLSAGVALPGYWAQGCAFADYDGDGRIDLFVTGFGRYWLLRNLGGLRFRDVTGAAGLAGGRGWSTAAAFADYDRDGRIDLYVSHYVDFDQNTPPLPKVGSGPNCMYRGFPVMCGPRGLRPQMGRLFHNDGGRFRDVSAGAGMAREGTYYGLGAVWSDLDNDADLDLYVATDSTPNLLYRNDGKGRFTEIGTVSGAAFNEEGRAQAGMGVGAADADNDGLAELLVTNFSHDYTTLYHNEGGMFFSDISLPSGIAPATMMMLGWGTGLFDYDNDGRRDLFIANGSVYPGIDALNIGTTWKQPNQLFRNEGDLRFREVTGSAGPALKEKHSARGAAFGDLDNDGDIDVVVVNMDEAPSLLRNDGGNSRHWIGFRLAGAGLNRGALGARVTLVAGAARQMGEVQAGGSHNSSSDPRLLFGLGDAAGPVRAEIRWPNGRLQTTGDLAVDRYHAVSEPAP